MEENQDPPASGEVAAAPEPVKSQAPQNQQTQAKRRLYQRVSVLFFISGFTSLIYQVIWTRQLVLVFGATTFATATALAVFMGGLALGSYLAGRWSNRTEKEFLFYGLLEGVIGLSALLVPALFMACLPLYQLLWQQFHLHMFAFSLVRLLTTAVILIVPTTCMGATLPLLSKFITSSMTVVGKQVGGLYAVNTAGAVCGALSAGFILLPLLGLNATTIIAAALNLSLCAAVIYTVRHSGSLTLSQPEEDTQDILIGSQQRRTIAVIATGFAVSGAVALSLEICWTRTISMVIGSSTYAFTTMLTTFLMGIALGSTLSSRLADRLKQPLLALCLAQVAVALCTLASMYWLNYVPYFNLVLCSFNSDSSALSVVSKFALSALILLPVSLSLGILFPLAVRAVSHDLRLLGRSVGTIYSANTVGAIVGSLLTGFVCIPLLGVEKTLQFGAGLNIAVAAVFLLLVRRRPAAITVIFTVGCGLALIGMMQPAIWNKQAICRAQAFRRSLRAGTYKAGSYADYLSLLNLAANLEFWKEGPCSTVAVVHFGNQKEAGRALMTNGCTDASDSGDMCSQVLLGLLPALVKRDAQSAAVIGWGSGVSMANLALFPLKSLTDIELEPAVLETAALFHHVNNAVEKDARLHIEYNDGRNYLLASPDKFDIIASEPSNPWQVGVCNLFTEEFFHIARERLTQGGVFSMWLQIHEIPPAIVQSILAAFQKQFPSVLIFQADAGNMIVLGSQDAIKIPFNRVQGAFANPLLKREFEFIGIRDPYAFLSRIRVSNEGVQEMVKGAVSNTDDRNWLEYTVGRTYENLTFESDNNSHFELHLGLPQRYVDWGTLQKGEIATAMLKVGWNLLLEKRLLSAYEWVYDSNQTASSPQARAILDRLDREFKR